VQRWHLLGDLSERTYEAKASLLMGMRFTGTKDETIVGSG
jgi:hypothetical protein